MNATFRCLVSATTVVILLSALPVTTFAQKLLNPSFEYPLASKGGGIPQDWFAFSSTNPPRISVNMQYRKAGIQSCRFEAQPETNAYQGIAQRFLAQAGVTYTFSVYVRRDPNTPILGGAYGQVSLEWQDANGVEIRREHGPVWGTDLTSDYWTEFTVESVVPEGAYFGVAVVTFFSNMSEGKGVFYVDDAELKTK